MLSIDVWWCGVIYCCLVVWCYLLMFGGVVLSIAVWWCGVSMMFDGVVYL